MRGMLTLGLFDRHPGKFRVIALSTLGVSLHPKVEDSPGQIARLVVNLGIKGLLSDYGHLGLQGGYGSLPL
jgi:hypothetical protein